MTFWQDVSQDEQTAGEGAAFAALAARPSPVHDLYARMRDQLDAHGQLLDSISNPPTPYADAGAALAARYEAQGEQAPGTAGQMRDVAQGFPLGAGAESAALQPGLQPAPPAPRGDAALLGVEQPYPGPDGQGYQPAGAQQQYGADNRVPDLVHGGSIDQASTPVNRTADLGIGDSPTGWRDPAGIVPRVAAGALDFARTALTPPDTSDQDTFSKTGITGALTQHLPGYGRTVAKTREELEQAASDVGAIYREPDVRTKARAAGTAALHGVGALYEPINVAGNALSDTAKAAGVPDLPADLAGGAVNFVAQGGPQAVKAGWAVLKSAPDAARRLAEMAPQIGRHLWQTVITPDVADTILAGAGIVAGPRGAVRAAEAVDAPLLDEAYRLYAVEQHSLRQIKEATGLPYSVLNRVIDAGGARRTPSMASALGRTQRAAPPEGARLTGKLIPYTWANGEREWMDSSYEAMMAHLLDSDPNIAYASGKLDIVIPYLDSKGGISTYHPDFLTISAKDGAAELIEIKNDAAIGEAAAAQTAGGANLDVMRKAEAGRTWAANLGMGYRIFTEDQIGRAALRSADPAQMPGLAGLPPEDLTRIRIRLHNVRKAENPAVARTVAEFNAATEQPRVATAAKYGINGAPALQGAARGLGAVAGGIAGHQLDDPRLSDPNSPDYDPILGNRYLIGGTMLGGLAGGAVERGGLLESAAGALRALERLRIPPVAGGGVLESAAEEAARLQASIESRAAAWEQAQQRLTALQDEIAMRSPSAGDVGAIERPPWASAAGKQRAWTAAELEDLAQRSGVNPYEPMWWQRLDAASVRAYRDEVVSASRGTSQVGRTPGQEIRRAAALRREEAALRAQVRTFEREMNQDLQRVSVLEQRAGREPFSWEQEAAPSERPAVPTPPGPTSLERTDEAQRLWEENQALKARLADGAPSPPSTRPAPPTQMALATGATRNPDVGPPLRGGATERLPMGLPPATTPIEAPPLQQEMQASASLRGAERGAMRSESEAARNAPPPPPAPRPTILGVPRPTLSEVASAAQSGPLANPGSLLNNALSGAFRTIQRVAQETFTDPLGTPADLDAMRRAIPDALAEAWREFKAGPSQALNRGLAAEQGGLEHSRRLVPTILTAGVRANVATDRFVSRVNEAGATARAARQHLSETDAAELAGQAADFVTYRGQPSKVAEWLSAARQTVDDPAAPLGDRATGAVVMALAPYVRTPERVLLASIGLATDPFTQPFAIARAVRDGNGPALREGIGRLVLGTVVDSWLAWEAAHGNLLHGDPPRDQAQRRRQEADGVRWNTIAGVPLRNYGPFGDAAGAIATTVAATQDAIKAGKPGGEVAQAGVDAALRWTLNKSYLRELGRFLDDFHEGRGSQAIVREAAGLATRPVSPLTSLVGAADPYERKTSSAGIRGELLATVPGGRYALPVQKNELGQPLLRGGSGLSRAFGQSVAGGPQGPQIRRYVGSSGAEQDAEIAAAIAAVHRYQANAQANRQPTSAERQLYAVFSSRGENPQYTRMREAELLRRQREALLSGGVR